MLHTIETISKRNILKQGRRSVEQFSIRGARRRGRDWESPHPTETEKVVVEKCRYFPELYKLTKVLEDRKNGLQINFPLKFSCENSNIFLKNLNRNWFLAQTRKI